MGFKLSSVVLTVVAAAVVLASAGSARADYTVKFCNGNPAAPWVNGDIAGSNAWFSVTNTCAQPGGTYAFNGTTGGLAPSSYSGAGVIMPSGVTLTNVALSYTTVGAYTTPTPNVQFGYDQTLLETDLVGQQTPQSIDYAVPNGTVFFARVSCPYNEAPYGSSTTASCDFDQNADIVDIGELDMTLHDTGAPTVTASGGGLAQGGPVSGQQALLYTAADKGSGVAKVTLALGTDTVGTTQTSCQYTQLQPCPASTNGSFAVDTTQLANGSYPVILTAYDASGDATPTQLGTVTIANATTPIGTSPTTVGGGAGTPPAKSTTRTRMHVKLSFHWHYRHADTTVRGLTISRRRPRGTTVTISCTGRGCPLHSLKAAADQLARLQHALTHRTFHPGEIVSFAIAAPHRITERDSFTIRRGAVPLKRRS